MLDVAQTLTTVLLTSALVLQTALYKRLLHRVERLERLR